MSSFTDYFSLNEIVTTHERIMCKFEVPVRKLGYLNQSLDNEDILPETKFELPLWLAQGLCSRRRQIISVDVPKIYKENYREILQADASVVDLHKIGPNFYDFALHTMVFEYAENKDIAECLLQTFKTRFKRIMDSSQNYLQNDGSELLGRLDEFEKNLFEIGKSNFKDVQEWQNRKIEKITTSTLVVNHRKRKRVDS